MTVEVVKCDECKEIRGESNHWIQVVVTPDYAVIGTALRSMSSDGCPILDLCSQACLQKVLGRVLDGFRKEAL